MTKFEGTAQEKYAAQVAAEQEATAQEEKAWTWSNGCELLLGIIAVAWIAAQIITRLF